MIRLIPTIPRDPGGRLRLLSLWFALFTLVGTAVDLAFLSPVHGVARLQGIVASIVLAAWFTWGYRRRRFPEFATPFEGVLLVAMGAASSMPLRAMGVFFAAAMFRALYVSRREFLLLPISIGVARALSIVFAATPSAYPALSLTVALQVAGLIIVSVTLYLLMAAIDGQAVAEHALQHSEERYRLLAAATNDMVYEWNVATDTVEYTDAIRTVFGFTDDDVVHDRFWWLSRIHPDDRAAYEATIAQMLASDSGVANGIRYRVQRGDGTDATVIERAVARRETNGGVTRVVGSVRDVTAEHRLEEQLRQAQKMEAIGQLAGGAAHDFNNLLTVIGGHVFMLEEHGRLEPEVTRHLDGITLAADRAGSLTRQLLAFGRRQVLKPAAVDLNAVVTDTVRLIAPVLGERVNVVLKLDAGLPPAMADAGQLEQVLINLAINARDAMPDGGMLEIATTASGGTDRMVRISFADTGTGMDAETIAHAFEPFYTTKSKGKGTGLGLATAYGIIKQSFGDITVDSALGKGSTFTVALPVAPDVPATIEAPAGVDAKPARRSSGKRVLLVEDDNDVRDFAREVLTRTGYTVFPARHGIDGLAVAKAQAYAFDLVVTDVVMPEMGGRQMVVKLRDIRPNLPVLYISGYADDPEARREVGAGEESLLEKPFTARTLRDAVLSVSGAD